MALEFYSEILIKIGKLPDIDSVQYELAKSVPKSYFHSLSSNPTEGFSFLVTCDYEDAFAYIRGLVICETLKVCPYPGSTSLLIKAFCELYGRPIEEWGPMADWVVTHHDNPYSPFCFQRTRGYWLLAMDEKLDPASKHKFVLNCIYERHISSIFGHRKNLITQWIHRLRKGDSPWSPDIREAMILMMEKEAGWPEENWHDFP